MNFNIVNERANIGRDIREMNRHQLDSTAYTVLATVREVNIKEYTCTVYVPSSSTTIHEVIIANACYSDTGTGLAMVPTIGQKCIVLLSQQHKPILVTTIPNQLRENDNKLLENEFKLGDSSSFIKKSSNGSFIIRNTGSVMVNNENGVFNYLKEHSLVDDSFVVKTKRTKGVSSSEEVYYKNNSGSYFVEKNKILNNGRLDKELINKILDDSDNIMEKTLKFLEFAEGINSVAVYGSDKEFSLLEGKIRSLKNDIDKDTFLKIEKGDSKYNKENNLIYSLNYRENGTEKFKLDIKKDGIAEITCKELIVNKN